MGCTAWGHKALGMTERLTLTYLGSNKREQTPCNNMDASQEQYAESKGQQIQRIDIKRFHLYKVLVTQPNIC